MTSNRKIIKSDKVTPTTAAMGTGSETSGLILVWHLKPVRFVVSNNTRHAVSDTLGNTSYHRPSLRYQLQNIILERRVWFLCN